MDEKEAKKKHKAWLRTAVQVAVQDHPAYAEYCKLQNCGVDENTLRDLMERESTEERALDFKLLRNPFQVSVNDMRRLRFCCDCAARTNPTAPDSNNLLSGWMC